MTPLVLSPELLHRAEGFERDFHLARMRAAMERHPELGIEVRGFGGLTAVRAGAPFQRSKNRNVGLSEATLPDLRGALAFFTERGLPCTATLPYDGWSAGAFDALVAAGMRSGGTAMPLAALPEPYEPVTDILVRSSPLDEKSPYRTLYRKAFDARWEVSLDELAFQWTEDTLPGSRRYVAEIREMPVAMASMAVVDEVAYLATCGVHPDWRRRGVQRAMIRARLADAHALGCTLALGGGRPFSPPRRNFERCGFVPLPLGQAWSYEPR